MIMQPPGSQARRVRFWRISPNSGSLRRDRQVSGFMGTFGSVGLRYVRVSCAENMRRGVRGRRTEGRFSADRPVDESPQDAREGSKKQDRATPKQKVALELFQNPRARAQCGRVRASPSVSVPVRVGSHTGSRLAQKSKKFSNTHSTYQVC